MKYLKNIIPSIVLAFVVFACSSSKNLTQNRQMVKLDSMMNTKNFTIESNWAQPQMTNALQQVLNSGLMQPGSGAGNISLIGNHNYLTISGDSIKSYLPYFGERQMNVDYGGGGSAIEFNGLMDNYEVKNVKDKFYSINFNAKSKSESFQVFIKIYPNLKTSMVLNSTSRFPISYSGEIKLEEKK
ncbi:hypothetical protein AXE80_06705 [Wenyingzhuangia fucanilytica]|uniref:DUF4251 domain-containing protein n=1 Tax=Wenyingzhuangia fucanilytica TaxID=1790137 RepID=A0A1B1Y5H0_9FLAO|nr:DUF4251 domain-containing protein [Wenyingzhuangia fucanilytica]ANW95988.1 hypothetical protein AXE80_06705 [Wenyingzhuangia fucanilytica]